MAKIKLPVWPELTPQETPEASVPAKGGEKPSAPQKSPASVQKDGKFPPVLPTPAPKSGGKPPISGDGRPAEGAGAKAPLGHGIAAYQSSMKKPEPAAKGNSTRGNPDEPTAGPESRLSLPKNRSPETAPRREPLIPGDGFVKTREQPGSGEVSKPEDNPFLKLPKVLPRSAENKEADPKIRRVAKFLILIGGDEAAGILAKLDMEQVEDISREIASIRGISSEEAAQIFEEFRSLLSSTYGFLGASSGGVEAARRLLYAAFGPEKGNDFLNKALPETKENPFTFMEEFNGEQIALLLKDESPAAAALILSRLPSKLSAQTLINIEPGRKMEIVRRIARQGETYPEVLAQVAGALREKARHIGSAVSKDTITIDGRNTLAAILKQSDISFGDRLLQQLDDEDPELSQELKERIHTLEDVVKADDRPLQEKLRSMPDKDIAMLLKGKTPEFTEKILSNISAQRRLEIREEDRILGPVPRRDVDDAAKAFLSWFRLNREEGRIMLIDDKDVIV
ncbi:flagellar motor switch protein FliG [Treponema primitia]|nr:flagellar motor switch protein FliG [Treponema primitia]